MNATCYQAKPSNQGTSLPDSEGAQPRLTPEPRSFSRDGTPGFRAVRGPLFFSQLHDPALERVGQRRETLARAAHAQNPRVEAGVQSDIDFDLPLIGGLLGTSHAHVTQLVRFKRLGVFVRPQTRKGPGVPPMSTKTPQREPTHTENKILSVPRIIIKCARCDVTITKGSRVRVDCIAFCAPCCEHVEMTPLCQLPTRLPA